MNRMLARIPALLLTLMVGLLASSSAFATAIIQIQNGDGPNVGFNHPGPPVPGATGNSGITLGDQRLKAFEEAARIWGATLTSGQFIVIRARWETLACSATSGTLGSAGNNGSIWRDFTGSVPGFWYGNALANALRGSDLNGAVHDINATFNVKLGQTDCLENLHWYYGLDGNEGAGGVDLVSVLLHEFGHGLGFQTFTSSSTGQQLGDAQGSFPSIYDRFLSDNTTGKTWPQMTNAERQASAVNTGNLVWTGPQVTADAPSVIPNTPRLKVNSPAVIARRLTVGTATFGPPLNSAGVTANVAQASPTDGCSALTNGAEISGRIALIDRGTCAFVVKVKNAQNAGAVGVVIINNVAPTSPLSLPPDMIDTDATITIPSVMIAQSEGPPIVAQLGSGVNATLLLDALPLMFTPNPVSVGSSVSHWDNGARPNQLMEPAINNDLSHSVTTPQDLTFSLFKDIGWCAGCPQPPPPSPTPTPSPVPPPSNDNFANSQVISGCSGSVTGTNAGATEEAGEPNNPASTGSTKSVWYQWQAPSTGSATIDTIGSGYDTILAVYTGASYATPLTLVGGEGVGFNDDIASGNTASTVTFPATQGIVYRIAVDGFNNSGDGGDTGSIKLNWTESPCSAASPTLQFSASAFSVGEGDGQATITITRAGGTSGAASVNYATSDTAGLQACTVRNSGNASERCDYATIVGISTFAAGDTSKTFTIPIVDDVWSESPAEVFTLTLSSPTGASLGSQRTATVTISDNDNDVAGAQNPFDDPAFFIRQLYIDFLGRLPDSNGFQDWFATLAGGIDSAGNSHPPCPNGGFGEPPTSNCDRLHVAAGFFLSDEFLNRGYFAYRFYMVAFNQRPTYAQFIPDMAQVGGPKSPAEEAASKTAYADAFVQRAAFTSAYPGLSGQALANALLQTAGLPAGSYNAGSKTNGVILREIAESPAASNKFFNEGIVSIQYFGFLRRDPDTIGYNNNLAALNSDPNNLRHMIFIFIYSDEYRFRFGP